MSTKIYQGVKINVPKLQDVVDLVRTYRKKHWEKDAKKLKIDFIQGLASAWQNGNLVVTDGATPMMKFEMLWMEMCKLTKNEGVRNRKVDTEFKLVIFPYKEYFLGIVYTEQEKWFDKFLKMPNVHEFGYWNNTDPPDDVTEEEWDERARIWNEALCDHGHGVPAMEGFTIDISDPSGPGFVFDEPIFKRLLHEKSRVSE